MVKILRDADKSPVTEVAKKRKLAASLAVSSASVAQREREFGHRVRAIERQVAQEVAKERVPRGDESRRSAHGPMRP